MNINMAIDTLNDEACKLDSIILQTYRLEDIKEAFVTAADASKSLKVVINFE